jgi:predicted metal-dependent hydrolase
VPPSLFPALRLFFTGRDVLRPAPDRAGKSRIENGQIRRGFSLNGATLAITRSDGQPLSVNVRVRENARRLILRVDRRSGTPVLTMPPHIARRRAEAFLQEHLGWLDARLKARPEVRTFVPGALVPVRGVPHRICHVLPFRGETRVESVDGQPCLLVHGDEAQVPARVLRFLKAEALKDLTHAVAQHAPRLGVNVGTISIKDTRSRWGSCAANGNLAFSWRLILAPPFVLDYLAVHEVAHRREMNHSPRYWRHVESLMPDFMTAENWLKQHGPSLHYYAV